MTIDVQPAQTESPPPPIRTCKLPPPELRQELRKIAGRTQEDVALQFGVSDGAVSYWEHHRPGRRYLANYLKLLVAWAEAATAMGLNVDWPAGHPANELRSRSCVDVQPGL